MIVKLVSEHFNVDFMNSREVAHDPLFGGVFPLHETAKSPRDSPRVLHSIVSGDHTVRFRIVGMGFVGTIGRVYHIADGTIRGRLATDDAEFLPPSSLELESHLDGRRAGKLTNGIALSVRQVRQVEMVEVDHAQAFERHSGNNVRVFLLGPHEQKGGGCVWSRT